MINGIMQIAAYFFFLILLVPIFGSYMAAVLEGRRHILSSVFGWLEKLIYKICFIDEKQEMNWKDYLAALLWFNLFGFLAVLFLQLLQHHLPLNPNHMPKAELFSAINTAVSFMTNTNWQGYAGETTMSYLTQMFGLTVQNFLSAATGLAVFAVLVRGFIRMKTAELGNFWADITRSVVYILLPICLVFSLLLVSQGVIQNFSANKEIITLEQQKQTLPFGPVASQIAIKQLGTNGGGYFNANSAHPYENPTPTSNFLEMLAILILPAALVYSFGIMIGSRKHAIIIFTVMLIILLLGLFIALHYEYSIGHSLGTRLMEGKETRLGVVNSILWGATTTAVSNGSVNAMHSSFTPLTGGVAMFNIMLGEIIFGGIGSGMYGMILFIMLTVFLAGLMAGRTPEYLGKKIEKKEILLAIIGILTSSIFILFGTSLALAIPAGSSSTTIPGPHGFSEILYAFTSAAGNNGSAFAGLNANTPFYNLALAMVMLIGRFSVIIPCIIIAGSMANKKTIPASSGTFSTNDITFAVLLFGVILIVAGLNFFPALALGPVMEHFLLLSHKLLF
ncbi:MAG: potassium-transporting ATPase subunit KdpA [Candidatus Margulisbacteria bacterium]|nr:potassium-transporting ATPase subunit KdpA [Candidatus Margulisiibacteriota bacterium]